MPGGATGEWQCSNMTMQAETRPLAQIWLVIRQRTVWNTTVCRNCLHRANDVPQPEPPMKSRFLLTTACLSLVTAACALDTPRELLKKLFTPDRSERGPRMLVEHCGRTGPHAAHHWDDDHGHHVECPGTPSRGLPVSQCDDNRSHATHVWADDYGRYCQCPGVRNLAVVRCQSSRTHEAHTWIDENGRRYQCPGARAMATVSCTSGRIHSAHVWEDEDGNTYQCPGMRSSYPKISCPSHKHHHSHVWEDEDGNRFFCAGHE